MSATVAGFEDERLRLWGGSAFAVLLVHLGIAALLLQHFQWQQPVSAGFNGTPDIELASLPAAAPRAIPQARPDVPSAQPRPVAQPDTHLEPLAPMTAVTAQPDPAQPDPAQPPSVAPPQDVSSSAWATAPVQASNVPLSPAQIWLEQVDQVLSQLQRYGEYPPSAQQRHEQDTVVLQVSIGANGQVLHFQVYSRHHFQDLERAAQTMLRRALPLPPPPPELASTPIVLHVPVEFHLVPAKTAAAVTRCARPANLGPVPAGAVASFEQMRAYQGRLNQYIAAARAYLNCLEAAPSGTQGAAVAATAEQAVSNNLRKQVSSIVDDFDAQTRIFETTAEHQALMAHAAEVHAEEARFAAAQGMAAKAYASCTSPSGPQHVAVGRAVSAEQMLAYRSSVGSYVAAVHGYLQCIDKAHQAALTATGSAITRLQRALLSKVAADFETAAVDPLNQAIQAFNAQLHLFETSGIRVAGAGAAPQSSAMQLGALAGTWSAPAPPLPAGECVRIAYSRGAYRASLCRASYSMVSDDAPSFDAPAGVGPQTYYYAVTDLQVTGRHVTLTITKMLEQSGGPSRNADTTDVPQQFDLTLSADGQRLLGVCSTDIMRSPCQFARQR